MSKYKLDFYSEKSQQFFLYIFILTPVVIFFSKFLADFFLSLISIYGLIYLLKNNKFDPFNYFIFFFIFIFISLNLLIQKPDLVLFIKSILLIRFPLFMLFPFIFNFDSKLLTKKFILIFIFPILIFLINLYSQAFLNYDIFGNIIKNDYQRVTSFFWNRIYSWKLSLFYIFNYNINHKRL